MTIRYEMIKRDIAGETILVPVGKAAAKFSGLITLNEAASLIWDRLPAAASEADLVSAVCGEFEVDPAVAAQDVHEFVSQLREMEILE